VAGAASANYFILETFDHELRCAVLQARFEVPDVRALRTVLGEQAADDPELRHGYSLDEAELAAVVAAFGVRFDPSPLRHTAAVREAALAVRSYDDDDPAGRKEPAAGWCQAISFVS
jgi:hypothetical protein